MNATPARRSGLIHGIDHSLQGEEQQSRFFLGEVDGLVIFLLEKGFHEITIDEGLTSRLDFGHSLKEAIVSFLEALEQSIVSVGVTFHGLESLGTARRLGQTPQNSVTYCTGSLLYLDGTLISSTAAC